MYTAELIEELVSCEKQIVEPPTKDYKEERGQLRKNFTLQSINGNYSFNGFIRRNIAFSENFTIGLDYVPREEKGTICLLRCNGTHGGSSKFPHHDYFHIHFANAETINNGLKPESNIDLTHEYASIEEAIIFFIKTVNLRSVDRSKYFPQPDSQTKLNIFDERIT